MAINCFNAVACTTMVVLATATAKDMPKKPNLLFMMADQMRHDALGAVTPSLTTPNLDRIGLEGARFLWGYTCTPTCTPARAAILTGQKPWNHGSLGAVAIAQKYPFEMPSALADLGYSTTSIGKDHFGWVDDSYGRTFADAMRAKSEGFSFFPPSKGHGVPHGYGQTQLYDGMVAEQDDFHQWFKRQTGKEPETGWPKLDMNSWKGEPFAYANESLHPTEWVAQNAIAFINNRAQFIQNESLKDAPWFLKISFHRPHSPYDPPQRFIDATPASVLRPVYTCNDSDPLAWDKQFSGLNGCGPQKLDAWCGDMPANESEFARRCYQGNIAFIDEWVGKIFDALNTSKQLDNTWMIWTADHGDGQSDHFHWRKGFPYEFSSHVPFMIRWPTTANDPRVANWKRGAIIPKYVVELRDIFPTFLDAAHSWDNGKNSIIPQGHPVDGDSLLCLLGGSEGSDASTCRGNKWRPYLDLEHNICYNATNHWNALFDGEIKYIFNAIYADGDINQNQLFNLTADPYELRDLARSTDPVHVAMVQQWRARMASQFLEEGRDKYAFVTSDGKLLQRVKGLGTSPNYPQKELVSFLQ